MIIIFVPPSFANAEAQLLLFLLFLLERFATKHRWCWRILTKSVCSPSDCDFSMWRRSLLLQRGGRVNPYALWLRENKFNPQLRGLGFTKRAKVMSTMYRELSAVERQALYVRTKTARPALKPNIKRVRRPCLYAKYLKRRYHSYVGSPRDRMRKIAKAWQHFKQMKNIVTSSVAKHGKS